MEKKKEVTIVTAYFDIKRNNYKEEFKRNNNKYIDYFKFWARIKNNVIIYTQKEFAHKIMEIREKFNLKDKTKIVIIDNVFSILPDIYEKMCAIEQDKKYFLNYRYIKESPDNLAKYNYIMLLKIWCMNDAENKGYIKKDYAAWLDFGFNHGGALYTDNDDFNFLWEYNFEDKIYLSSIVDDDDKPIFQIVQSGEVYIQGGAFVVPRKLITKFYNLIMDSMNSLLELGFMDDDQTLLLMAYRKNKNLFKCINCGWFMLLKILGGNHLKTREFRKVEEKNIIKKLLYKYRVNKRNYNYLKGIKKIFLKNYLD